MQGQLKVTSSISSKVLTGIGVNRSIIPQTLDRRENGSQYLRILYGKLIYNHEKNPHANFNKLNSELQCLPSQEDKKFLASRAQALIQPQGVRPGIGTMGHDGVFLNTSKGTRNKHEPMKLKCQWTRTRNKALSFAINIRDQGGIMFYSASPNVKKATHLRDEMVVVLKSTLSTEFAFNGRFLKPVFRTNTLVGK